MLVKHLPVTLGAEIPKKPRRPLDVGEEEGDGPHRAIVHGRTLGLSPFGGDRELRDELRADQAVLNNKGIYEYLLGGKMDPKLLDVRLFNQVTKVAAYEQQTQKAKGTGVSNCPLCAIGTDANKTRVYKQDEMDADHVTAWSKGGNTDLKNCQMLCVTHNRAKGNR